MQRFLSLLHREWQRQYGHFYLTLGTLILYLIVVPLAIKKFFSTNLKLEDLVMIPLIAVFILFFLIPIQFALNLRQECKNRDVWLHTPSPFWQLIAAKVVYYLVNTIALFAVISLSLLTSLRLTQNTSVIDFIPIIFSTALISIYDLLTVIIFILIAALLVLFFKRYIGRFAYFLTFVLMSLLIWLQIGLEESSFFKNYIYNGINLLDYMPLPKLYDITIYNELAEFFYVKDIFLNFIIYAVIAHFITKWLERVIKR